MCLPCSFLNNKTSRMYIVIHNECEYTAEESR